MLSRKLSSARGLLEGAGFVLGILLLVALTSLGTAAAAPAPAAATLAGTLEITAGSCSHGQVSGTYIQMILPSGSASGPYMSNSDSSCSNQAYTLLAPGTDGGLEFGSYQPLPSPPFDSDGNARAHAITAPAQYEGTAFATSTNPVDPQTRTKVAPPTLTVQGHEVTADLRSFSVSWNKQYFNQGSPKPDGSRPGITRAATGTYDSATGAMTLSWTSQVVGGPFDKFTGSWHLVGRFVPATTDAGSAAAKPGKQASSAAAPGAATPPSGIAPAPVAHRPKRGSGAATVAGPVPDAAAPDVAATRTVSRDSWHVAWWLVGLAIGIAVLGFGGLALLSRASRPAGPVAS